MQIHMLGTGTPDPKKDRFGTAFILEIGEERMLIDCGPGTTYKMGLMGIAPQSVNHLFLTHHHFDHNADVPCFALTWWDQNPQPDTPLSIYGPKPTETFIDRLLGPDGAFYDDIVARLQHPASHWCHQSRGGSLPRPAPQFIAKDVCQGTIATGENWSCMAQPVHHVEPWLQSLVFRFETTQGSVVFTGDAGYCDELVEICQGVDTLVICCAYRDNPDISPDVTTVVTGVGDVARITEQAKPKRIILTHTSAAFSPFGAREHTIAQISKHHDGMLIFGDELTSIPC